MAHILTHHRHPRELSPIAKLVAGILTALLLLGVGAGLTWADALPTGASDARPISQTEILPGKIISAEWDGPAVNLDWTGAEYARAETTFIGERLVVPGDHVKRTLNVTNAGPNGAVAAVTLDLSGAIPGPELNAHLANDVTLFWDIGGVTGEASFAALQQDPRVTLAEAAIAQGTTIPVTVGFDMASSVSATYANSDTTELGFDVAVTVTGNTTPATPQPMPQVAPDLAVTGSAGILALLCGAAVIALLGFLLVARRRAYAADRS